MKKKKELDAVVAEYADALAGKDKGRAPSATVAARAVEWGEEGKVLMNTIQTLHEALRPMSVPAALAAKVRQQVRHEIAGGLAPAQAMEAESAGFGDRLRTTAQAFLRRAGELVLNVNLGELLGARAGLQAARPAEVYAYSVVEALDKAARRRKARILLDSEGHIYEVPQSALKRYALSASEIKRRGLRG